MLMRCPHCGSAVEPARDARGGLLCPACRNTGRLVAPAAPPAAPSWGAPPGPAGPAWAPGAAAPAGPPATDGRAIAALVVGICALLLWPLAPILGIVAIVLGVMALGRIKRTPGSGGRGLATAGIVLGAVGIVVGLVVLAAVVFVLVSNLGTMDAEETWSFEVDGTGPGGALAVEAYPGFPDWDEFALGGSASCRLPSGSVDHGDEIVCATDGTVLLLDVFTGEQLYSATV